MEPAGVEFPSPKPQSDPSDELMAPDHAQEGAHGLMLRSSYSRDYPPYSQSPYLAPPTEKRPDESRPVLRPLPLEVIAENPRFPRQNLNGPQPGIGFHTPGFSAKAIVVFAAELPQLSHEMCILATLNFDKRDETGMRRMAFDGSHDMRQAYPEGRLESADKAFFVQEVEYDFQGMLLMLVHRLTSRADGPLPPPTQICQQRLT